MPRRKDPNIIHAHFWLQRDLLERVRAAADARDVSQNVIAAKALGEFLDRLIPLEEVRWTRDDR